VLRSSMARRIYLWLPSLAACALAACGGSANDFFSNGGGSGRAGASSHAGSTSSSGASNSAGASSSAGDPGNAGAFGVGGTNSGGTFATGGNGEAGRSDAGAPSGGSSSGGRAGASSSGGSGGRTGTGGNSATGGHAGAQTGSAGAGGSKDDPSCDDLIKQANQQLEAARACSLAASSIQCNDTVKNLCNCEVAVRRDDSTETKAYLATLKKIDDKKCTTICTAQACKLVTIAQCKSSGSGTTAVCTAVIDGPGHGY
jgi:hypothetical protein